VKGFLLAGGVIMIPNKSTVGVLELWSAAVGAVVSGYFYGWQGILLSGFWNGAVALLLCSVLYLLLTLCLAELSSGLGVKGGPPGFAIECFGARAGLLVGVCEVIKVIFVVAMVTAGIGIYLCQMTGLDNAYSPLIWAISIAGTVVLSSTKGGASFQVLLLVTVSSVVMLLVFYIGAAVTGHWIQPGSYANHQLSITGTLHSLPFSMWFFLGLEELPLLWELTQDPAIRIPRALMLSFGTLLALAAMTFFISCSVSPGPSALATDSYPLLTGYRTVFGDSDTTSMWCLLLVTGLFASQQSFVFATGELIQCMATYGFMPSLLAKKSPIYKTPIAALSFGGVMSFLVILLLWGTLADHDKLGGGLIAPALFASLLSYMAQLACFCKMRWYRPTTSADSAFKSIFGVSGAVIAIALCVIFLVGVAYVAATEEDYGYGLALGVACGAFSILMRACATAAGLEWYRELGDSHGELGNERGFLIPPAAHGRGKCAGCCAR